MPLTNTPSFLVYSAAATLLASSIAFSLFTSRSPKPIPKKIIESPRTTLLPRLSSKQAASLGYPPDALPGSRDVNTPFGSTRVYEWGDPKGRKVLMVHGDATPSPVFGPIARELVDRGCRVLTFDLWGRGYSDTPLGDPHNSTLYIQQILYALISSPIQWTGENIRFSIIGFSMGGAITLDFFAHHPALVESLVLLGPAGLLRSLPPEYTSFYFGHPNLISASRMRILIGTLLGVEVDTQTDKPVMEVDAPEGFSPAGSLQFQFDYHQGHVQSMLSNVQYGPIQHQEDIWGRACEIIAGKVSRDTPLFNGKILVICGQDDSVVPPKDVRSDLEIYLGEEGTHWELETVPGGHGFLWPEGTDIGRRIAEFWDLT